MASGGARAHGGPAPDPNALRRDRPSDAAEWVVLPEGGYEGDVPSWPLSESTKREDVLWVAEWRRPQAVMWVKQGQEVEVALYVRALAEAEKMDASTSSRTLVKQLMESLGISVPGLLRNRWKIGTAPQVAASSSTRVSSRDRLTVVRGA